TQASALLFGNVLGVSPATLHSLLWLAVFCLGGLAFIGRPLLFASLEPELAQARGVSLRLISVLFLVIVAVAVAESVQVVGILLVFALMVGPAAAAGRLTGKLWWGLGLSVLLAAAETTGGIVLAYVTDWPTSFWISFLSAGVYLLSLLARPGGQRTPA
ncbi:MAG: metal ABC transporter permease, partial [Deinococcus sp.]